MQRVNSYVNGHVHLKVVLIPGGNPYINSNNVLRHFIYPWIYMLPLGIIPKHGLTVSHGLQYSVSSNLAMKAN